MKLVEELKEIVVIDDLATGQKASALRKGANIKLKSMAKVMKISNSYLCELEAGKRRWSTELIKNWNNSFEYLEYANGPKEPAKGAE